jgi:PKD repeat protein
LFSAFDPVEPAPPAAPQVLGAVRASGVVTVSWLEPDNGGSPITGYNVYRSTTTGTETFLANVPGNTTTKYIDSAAPSSSNWFYRVTAVNAVAEGPFCREVNVNGSAAAATACLAPYIKMGGPGIPGNISPDPSQGELTIESINVGEPFTNCTDNSVTLSMKVKTLDPGNTGQAVLPSNAEWKFNFVVTTPDNVDHEMFVSMDTFAFNNASTASPNFSYGRKDPTPTGTQEQMECFEQSAGGVEIFHCANLTDGSGLTAQPSASFTKDGTITIKLNFSVPLTFSAPQAPGTGSPFTWNGSAVGTKLKHVRGSTVLLAGVFLEVVQTTGAFPETATGCPTCPDYTRIGNVTGCNVVVPIAILSANPLTGNAPLGVTFDGSASNEPFGACGTINSYTLDFGDGTTPVTQSSPSFSHTYTAPGDYPARLTVSDTAGHVSANAAQVVIHVASVNPPQLASVNPVVSRMMHGTIPTPFDVNLPLTGARGVECRRGSTPGNYTMVFTFANNLVSVGGAGLVTGFGSVSSSAIGPNLNQYTVNLINVTNQQYLSVALLNAKDRTGAIGDVVGPQMGVLIGDTTSNGSVNSSDIAQTQSQSGQVLTSNNFREDVTINGAINSSDIATVQAASGTALPSLP